MGNAGMKDIKHRINSVSGTMQITKAMELVASSKLKRAKDRAERSRPFFNTLYELMCSIADNAGPKASVYTRARTVKTACLVVIAGDRGLAGGYNSGILKMANAKVRDYLSRGINVKIVAIGKKAADFFEKLVIDRPEEVSFLEKYLNFSESVTMKECTVISDMLCSGYRKREIDNVEVFYTNFVTALTQQPGELAAIPLSFEGQKGKRELKIYDPSPEDVFDSIVPQYMAGLIYGAAIESFASEQAARRTAMESASDNANEMIDELSLKYNRARQAAITQEISEIVGGAAAL